MSISRPHSYSVVHQSAIQRRLDILGAVLLLLGALMSALVLGVNLSPKLSLIILVLPIAVVVAGALWRNPVWIVYVLVFAALFIEQWPILGLNPISYQIPFWATFAELGLPIPPPLRVNEGVLFFGLAAMLLPRMVGRGARLRGGVLLGPLVFFVSTVVLAFLNGIASGDFWVNAAWIESRSFIYLAVTYWLACNLIETREQLERLIWIIIVALGVKSVQGVQHYMIERNQWLDLPALTGHEDVVFFNFFLVLLAAKLVYGVHGRQRHAMLAVLPVLFFTELATGRRIAFIILPVGMMILGLSMMKMKRALFFKVAPPVVLAAAVYFALFWGGGGGVLGEPVRAIKSQISEPATERDRSSDLWRDLENVNVSLNIKSAPLTGLGFGRTYTFFVEQYELTFTYRNYITHNAIYWVWMKMGVLGFTAFWYLLGSAMIYGLILLRQLSDGYLRAVAISIVSLVAMQIFFSYGDLGLTYSRTMIFLGLMLGVLVSLSRLDTAPVQEPTPVEAAAQQAYSPRLGYCPS